jgi:hypothetical protein
MEEYIDRDPRQRPYPEPEIPTPSMDELLDMVHEGVVEATDGCDVEPDGMCEHGHPSWLLAMDMI